MVPVYTVGKESFLQPEKCPYCGSYNLNPATIEVKAVCAAIFDDTGKEADDLKPPEIAFTLEGWECLSCENSGCDEKEIKRRIEVEANKILGPAAAERAEKKREERRRLAELN
jgi:hypothetical protein